MHKLSFSIAVSVLLLSAAPVHAHDPALTAPLPSLVEYFPLGIEHVLIGYDHLAFVLGLMLLTTTRRALLGAVTSFTVAHSLSLSACVLGIVTPPSSWVEAAIALSIAYVALAPRANHATSRMQPLLISGLFGFVHGFGFAGALEELGVPLNDTAAALALFNFGVEAGQLLALCAFAPAVTWLRKHARGIPILRYALFAFGMLLTASRAQLIIAQSTAAASGEAFTSPHMSNNSLQRREVLQSAYVAHSSAPAVTR